jgi:hypothetical protein
MEEAVVLEVAANGDDIKLMWRAQKRWRQTWSVKAATLRKQSKKLRAILDRLNAYVERNPDLDSAKDSEGTYARLLTDLRVAGRGLFLALFNNANAGSPEEWVAGAAEALSARHAAHGLLRRQRCQHALGLCLCGPDRATAKE